MMDFCSFCSWLLLFVVLLYQAEDAIAKDRHGREFVRGKGATLTVETGDTIVSSLIVSKKTSKIPVHPPYRWYYAINSEHFLFFTYAKSSRSMKLKPKIIERRRGKYASVNFVNHQKKQPHVGPVGSLVAILMVGNELPFNLLFCNSKHYVEYLSRGYAKGRWYKLLFNRTSKNCPVFAPLSSDPALAFDVYNSKSFELRDKTGKPTLLTVHDWPPKSLPEPPKMERTWGLRGV